MIQALFKQFLVKLVLVALLGFVLYGIFPGSALAIILGVFAAMRLTALLAEALRMTGNPQPRPKLELAAEVLGVLAFVILLPLDVALYTRDFFSLRTPQGWEGAVVAAAGVALYLWPRYRWKSPDWMPARIAYWAFSFAAAALLLNHAIQIRHPYLDPFDPDHKRLAAIRVLSLTNNLVAGRIADWVLRYARELEDHGNTEQAVHYFREGLRLDPSDRSAAADLARLEAQLSGNVEAAHPQAAPAAFAPYWTDASPIVKPPRHAIDSSLTLVTGCTVVVVAVGEVPDDLLDAVGYAIQHELDLPVYVSPTPVPLPPPTRMRGLLTGYQWDAVGLANSFVQQTKGSFPRAPIKYVLVTTNDIYAKDVNYLYSCSFPWGGAMVSSRANERNGRRFPGAATDRQARAERTAESFRPSVIAGSRLRHQLHSEHQGPGR